MPTLLFIDTSATVATVALAKDGISLAIAHHENAHEQAALLNGMIAKVFTTSGLELENVDGVCVCAGPGSYTGLRVGLSTAKGLCYALEKPILLFNKLDLLAIEFNRQQHTVVALKARAGEYFYAVYDEQGDTKIAPKHALEEDLKYIILSQPSINFVTDDVELSITENTELLPVAHKISVAAWVKIAETRFHNQIFDDVAYCEPFYLKAAYTTQSKK